MIRRAIFAVVLIVIWLGVLGWAVDMRWNTPLVPRAQRSLAGYDFQARFGSGTKAGEAFSVDKLGEDGTGLQTAMPTKFDAAELPILRYRIANFPRTLELAVVFRRNDAPEDVQTISLPSPGGSEAVVDLSSFSEWHGEITELGFAEYATAQLVPPSVAGTFAPFAIERVTLQSRAWNQLVPRLRTDWFAYRPWALRSEHTLGTQFETLKSSSMQFAIGIGTLLSLLATALILRLARREFATISVVALAAAWFALDLRWLVDLDAKHRLTETVYADKPWALRETLQPDEATIAAALEVKKLAAETKASRVLVGSDSNYTTLRFTYFLLPLNAVGIDYAMSYAQAAELPRGTLIALLNSDWHFDAASMSLQAPNAKYLVTPVFDKDGLRVYRLTEERR